MNKIKVEAKEIIGQLEKMKVMNLQEAEELGFGGYDNQYEHAKDVHNNALDQAIKLIRQLTKGGERV